MEKKKSQWETIKCVLKYTKKYNIYIAFSLILAAVTVVLTLYLPILTGNAVDLMLGKDAVKFTGLMAILKMIAEQQRRAGLSTAGAARSSYR